MGSAEIFNTTIRSSEAVSLILHERVAVLYDTYRDKIYGFLVGQGLDPGKSQELTQDVFIRLFIALQGGKEIESERAWLYGVASKLAAGLQRLTIQLSRS